MKIKDAKQRSKIPKKPIQVGQSKMLKLLFTLLFFLSTPKIVWSESQKPITNPEQCKLIKSSLQRLTCFDQFFKTPVVIPDVKKTGNKLGGRTPEIIKIAMRIEEQRTSEITGLLREDKMEHESARQQRIIFTSPAIGSHPPRPLLMISCINNITRLQIGLHSPVNKGKVDVALNLSGRTHGRDHHWRIIGSGLIADAGHGIPSIDILKTMIGHNRVLFHSDEMVLEGLTFDITGFTHYVKSFRTACHW